MMALSAYSYPARCFVNTNPKNKLSAQLPLLWKDTSCFPRIPCMGPVVAQRQVNYLSCYGEHYVAQVQP